MTKRMAVAEVKAHLSEVIRKVEGGERVVVERRGRPVAVIGRYEPAAEREERGWFDALHGILSEVADFDQIMEEVVRSRRDARPRPVDLETEA